MAALVTLATCNLNQWALDFDGNKQRIIESIKTSKEKGARYRIGPELEITGYGCEDHFYEMDTHLHAWEVLVDILSSDLTDDIICDIGMPIIHRSIRYNCRVYCLNRKIILIRPKMFLADDGNYREGRWFASWNGTNGLQEYLIPAKFQAILQQTYVPIGFAILSCLDYTIASETCEELFTPNGPHISLALNGVDILSNGSASHHQLRKLNTRVNLMTEATRLSGGVYVYSNQKGCDGGRLYFDGCSMIVSNGNCLAQAPQFSMTDVEVITATVNLDDVASRRSSQPSLMRQAVLMSEIPRVKVHFHLKSNNNGASHVSPSVPVQYKDFQDEIGLGPACWLWDYLRRSNGGGFFLPLSGGADSAATCTIVGIMCKLVIDEAHKNNEVVFRDLQRILDEPEKSNILSYSSEKLANRLLHTCYIATENNSPATKDRAEKLAQQIGSYHFFVQIDAIVIAFISIVSLFFNKAPRFKQHNGSNTEDLALQNLQARIRMVVTYLFAQLLPFYRGFNKFLIVLGSANVDESLRGYFTKYDCSSADINPIGSFSKTDLRAFLLYAMTKYNLSSIHDILIAPPSAELRPRDEVEQLDEVDMGMSYDELSVFGRLRKVKRCGPLSMFLELKNLWKHLSDEEISKKVKHFFVSYAYNRHKMTTITPSYHSEEYSPDDNRFDLRPFLYPTAFRWQFAAIDVLVKKSENKA
jgi:NAD+ synthase (glutamine-hydrolysing)